MRDTCICKDGQDTCGIHSRYIQDTFKIHDEIHVSQMHPERDVSDMKETCGIHSRYMRDTCICKADQDTCEIHAGHVSRGLRGLGECIDASSRAAHLSGHPCDATHVLCIVPPIGRVACSVINLSLLVQKSWVYSIAPSSSSIFSFVMATLIPAGLPLLPPGARRRRGRRR
jgi:hypothetical protein